MKKTNKRKKKQISDDDLIQATAQKVSEKEQFHSSFLKFPKEKTENGLALGYKFDREFLQKIEDDIFVYGTENPPLRWRQIQDVLQSLIRLKLV